MSQIHICYHEWMIVLTGVLQIMSPKLDLFNGYWQVPLGECTAKISAYGILDLFLEYTVMGLSTCNTLTTFLQLVNTVLADLVNCNIYLLNPLCTLRLWKNVLRS